MADRYRSTFNPYDNLSPVMKDSQGNLESGLNIMTSADQVIVEGTGTNSFRYINAVASGDQSIALGDATCQATGVASTAIGDGAQATAQNAIAMGFGCTSTGFGGIAIGSNCAAGLSGICLGNSSASTASAAIALGAGVTNSLGSSLRVGNGTNIWFFASTLNTISNKPIWSSTVTDKTGSTAYNLAAADIVPNNVITQQDQTANVTATLPTAATVIAQFDEERVGDGFCFTVVNLAAANTFVLAADGGATHTLVGNMTVAAATSARFQYRITNITGGTEAATIYRA